MYAYEQLPKIIANTDNSLQLKPDFTHKLQSDGLTLRFSEDGEYLAVGCKNGTKMLYSLVEGIVIGDINDTKENAVTSLKWKTNQGKKQNILVSADSGGHIMYWHVPSMKCLFKIYEDDNSVNTIDFNREGDHFATAGKDSHVRIYDEETKSVSVDIKPAEWNHSGHSNRIFAVKYFNRSTIISGGWDNVVHVWDIRQGKSIKSFFGPNVSGESIDFQDNRILIGVYSASNQLQIWDFHSGTKMEEYDWTGDIDHAEYIYTAAYSKFTPRLLGAGSTGENSEVRLFTFTDKLKQMGSLRNLSSGCFSLDFCPSQEKFAFTTPNNGFYVYNYKLT